MRSLLAAIAFPPMGDDSGAAQPQHPPRVVLNAQRPGMPLNIKAGQHRGITRCTLTSCRRAIGIANRAACTDITARNIDTCSAGTALPNTAAWGARGWAGHATHDLATLPAHSTGLHGGWPNTVPYAHYVQRGTAPRCLARNANVP